MSCLIMTNQGKRKHTVSLDELLNTHYKVHTIWAGHSHATTSRRNKHYDISIDRITSVKILRQISYSYNIVSSLVAVILYCQRFVGTSSFLAHFSRKYYKNCSIFFSLAPPPRAKKCSILFDMHVGDEKALESSHDWHNGWFWAFNSVAPLKELCICILIFE